MFESFNVKNRILWMMSRLTKFIRKYKNKIPDSQLERQEELEVSLITCTYCIYE